MAFLNRDENPPTARANFSAATERSFDGRAIICRLDHPSGKMNVTVRGCRSQKFDLIFGGHRAWDGIRLRLLHQTIRSRPIAVAIEQRADNSAIQNARKRLIFLLRRPISDDFIAFGEAPDMETFGIRGSAAKTGVVRRVSFLQ